MSSVALLDYGMGNLRSLGRALERAGASVVVASSAGEVARADRIAVPGQGAFGRAMEALSARGLVAPLMEAIAGGKPVLGVCLGLQVLFASSEEAPGVAGLGVIPAPVTALPVGPGVRRPHMGWAPVARASSHQVLSAIADGEAFYFVHSFAAREAPGVEVAWATHGERFVAAVARGTLLATQFHPEKSQDAGARLLEAWLRYGA